MGPPVVVEVQVSEAVEGRKGAQELPQRSVLPCAAAPGRKEPLDEHTDALIEGVPVGSGVLEAACGPRGHGGAHQSRGSCRVEGVSTDKAGELEPDA